jgi:hypothetical protein
VGSVDGTQKFDINDSKGCRMKVNFKLNKVPGNFHVSTHASHEQPVGANMGHQIHDLTFGEHVDHLRNIPDSSFTALNDVIFYSNDRNFCLIYKFIFNH